MKKKLLALLIMGTLCFSLAACGETGISAAREAAEKESDEDFEDEGDYEIEIPDSIVNISPEDDKALTGVLTEDSYTNEYFGFIFHKSAGALLESVMEEGLELTPLSEAYENGIGCIAIRSVSADETNSFNITISALTSDQLGKTEEELAQERFDQEQKINEALEFEPESKVEKVTLFGEEHPAYTEVYTEEGDVTKKYVGAYIIKGDFLCEVSTYAPVDQIDDLLKQMEKIQ